MTRHDLVALARRDPSLPALDVLLDSAALSDALGHEIRLTRVRYKPGASVVVAFRSADAARVPDDAGPGWSWGWGWGWAASYANDDKPAKTIAKSLPHLPVRRIPTLAHAVTGPAFADRALRAPLEAVGRRDPEALRAARIMRHNPHRRLLLVSGEHVLKVSASTDRPVDLAPHHARGVPLLVTEVWAPGVTATTHWGAGDLAVTGSADHAGLAGSALAALHEPALDDAHAPAYGVTLEREIADAVAGLRAIDPAFAVPALRIAATAPRPRVTSFIHGDFSADQVLTGDGIRLIDFDRAGPGDAHRDLGSFVAGEWARTGGAALAPAMLAAYRDAGGRVQEGELRAWTAVCLLLRAAEPFRTARPQWHEEITHTLAHAEAVCA